MPNGRIDCRGGLKLGGEIMQNNINIKDYEDKAELLKAIAHPVRLCIIYGLMQKGECNVSYMQNCLNLPQSTVSQHLQRLRRAKIVQSQQQGPKIKYMVANEKIKRIINTLFEE